MIDRTVTSNENPLLKPMRDLYRAYVRLLESGKERIEFHGGTCDSVEQMERDDPYLRAANIAMQAVEIEQRHSPETDDAPELTEADFARAKYRIGGKEVSREEWQRAAQKASDQRAATDANALADAHRMYETEHGKPFSESESEV